MREIMADISVSNPLEPSKCIRGVGLIDTGSAFPILPASWKREFGPDGDQLADASWSASGVCHWDAQLVMSAMMGFSAWPLGVRL